MKFFKIYCIGVVNMKICAFTGHRPKSFSFGDNENHPDCIQLKQVLRNQIERLYFEGFTHFITGCAMGVDIWAYMGWRNCS